MDDSNADACQRCARSGRPCVFTPLQKRKQRKRTDTRVAELEREMRTMRAMFKNKQASQSETTQKERTVSRAAGLWYAVSAWDETRCICEMYTEYLRVLFRKRFQMHQELVTKKLVSTQMTKVRPI